MPDIIDRDIEENEFRHILLDEFKIRIAPEMGDVVHRAGDKIVNADDLVPAGKQEVRQVRAEESGSAGDDGSWLFGFGFHQCDLFGPLCSLKIKRTAGIFK